jgi:DNA-binding CsgD family transcriptional regulator
MCSSEWSKRREDSHDRIDAPGEDPGTAEIPGSNGIPGQSLEEHRRQIGEASGDSSTWSAAMEAFDCLAIGLAICDATGAVQFLNRTANRIVRDRDVLRFTDSAELDTVANDAPSLKNLFQNLPQPVDITKGEARALVAAIPRSSGLRPLTIIIRRAEKPMISTNSNQLIVVMLEGNHLVEAHSSDLYSLFAFTPAETRFANQLMSGKTTAEACAALGISHSTGCSHLRNMFKKTRVHRQGELVALMLRSIGMLRFSASKSILGQRFPVADALSGQNQAKLTTLIQRDVDSIL